MRMKRIYTPLLGSLIVLLSACSMDEYNEVCDYSVELHYDYNRESTTTKNVLRDYVGSVTEYIFDSNNILYAVNSIEPDPCDGILKSERQLPSGRYTVISWGNLSKACSVTDAHVGTTTRQEMELSANNPCNIYAGYQNNSDRLYHAYRTFTVNPTGISRIRVDMTHAHLSLRFRVRWGTGTHKPLVGQEVQLRITNKPSQYDFMPEFIFHNGIATLHDTTTNDPYNSVCQTWTPHIPKLHNNRNVLHHRLNANVDTEREAYGEFVTLRLLNGSPATLSLHQVNNNGDMLQIGNDINLGSYFRGENIELSRNLRQEFAIELLVNSDGTLSMQSMQFAEWDEGGSLGMQ